MTESGESRELQAFLEGEWVRCLTEWPELATVFGMSGHNDRWTDYSLEAISNRAAQLQTALRTLAQIDRTRLAEADRLNYDLYATGLTDAQAGLPYGFEPLPLRLGAPSNLWMPLSQMGGIQVDPSLILDLQPRGTADAVGDIVRRVERLPVAIRQTIALLRAGLSRGFSPPRVALRGVPRQIEALIPSEPRESALLQALGKLPTSVPSGPALEMRARAEQSYRDHVAPAYRELLRYLAEEYLPACREPVGASALPDGSDAYAYLVRLHTTTDLTPQQVHEIGLAEVERIRGEVQQVMARAGFHGTFAEFTEKLRTDPSFYFQDATALLDAYRSLAKQVEPELPRLFGRLPRLPYGIVPVPEFSAPTTPAAYYMSGSPEAGRAGFFFANTYDLGVRPKWGMEDLLLHEAVPGHHLQLALAAEIQGLPSFRKHTGPTAYVEGWGLYAESLGEELGRYQDPYSKYGQLDGDLWRAIRLVVDTGMHALGWSREKALTYFQENSGRAEHEATVEIDRYIVWPGQALAYKMGQLKIRELRTRAEQRLGPRFDVRAFHDLVLAQGALPLRILERTVDRWIEETLKGATAKS